MTNERQEVLASETLMLFKSVWCESAEKENEFNCTKCIFQNNEGWCYVKMFVNRFAPIKEAREGKVAGMK